MRELYRMCPWTFPRMAEDESPADFWRRAIAVETLDLVRACPALRECEPEFSPWEAMLRFRERWSRRRVLIGPPERDPYVALWDCRVRLVWRVLGPQEFLRDAQLALEGRRHLLEHRQPRTVLLCRHEIRGD
jgi:hypothetical protein